MRTPSVLLLLSAACALVVCPNVHGQAGAGITDQRLAVLRESFKAAVNRDALKSREEAVATLDKGYIASVERELAGATRAGDLDLAVGLKAEIERVQNGGKMLSGEDKKKQQALKPLRENYRVALAKIDADYLKRFQPIADRYDQALAGLQMELTKASKLDDATRIKGVREQLAKARESGDLDLLSDAAGAPSGANRAALQPAVAASIKSAKDLTKFLAGTVWTWEVPNSKGTPGKLHITAESCQVGTKTAHPWKAMDSKSVEWTDDGTTMKFNRDYTAFEALCGAGPRSGKRVPE
jgi:hypothetical protein